MQPGDVGTSGEPQPAEVEAVVRSVVSVFGPFGSRALVEMSVDEARDLVGEPLADHSPRRVIDGVQHDLEALRQRAPELADSGLAASAVALAYELEHPYNSATSKAACAKALLETLDRLRQLAPPQEKRDGIDRIADGRHLRLAGGAAAPDPAGS